MPTPLFFRSFISKLIRESQSIFSLTPHSPLEGQNLLTQPALVIICVIFTNGILVKKFPISMLYRVLIRTDSLRNDIHLLKQCDH